MARFEVYEDEAGEFRWRLRSENGEIVAQSESYGSRWDAERGAKDAASASSEAMEGEIEHMDAGPT